MVRRTLMNVFRSKVSEISALTTMLGHRRFPRKRQKLSWTTMQQLLIEQRLTLLSTRLSRCCCIRWVTMNPLNWFQTFNTWSVSLNVPDFLNLTIPKLQNDIAAAAVEALTAVHGTAYRYGSIIETLYAASGLN